MLEDDDFNQFLIDIQLNQIILNTKIKLVAVPSEAIGASPLPGQNKKFYKSLYV